MLSTLFQPEISNLESQILQLQAQIALRQERISRTASATIISPLHHLTTPRLFFLG